LWKENVSRLWAFLIIKHEAKGYHEPEHMKIMRGRRGKVLTPIHYEWDGSDTYI
jgi:hypothetical protein